MESITRRSVMRKNKPYLSSKSDRIALVTHLGIDSLKCGVIAGRYYWYHPGRQSRRKASPIVTFETAEAAKDSTQREKIERCLTITATER